MTDADEVAGADAVDTGAPRSTRLVQVSAVVAITVLIADQITKHWAVNALADGAERHVVWKLQWNLAFNSGMAFSRGTGFGQYIGAIAMVVVIALVVSLRTMVTSRLSALAVGMIVGGACGNLGDRLFRGEGFLRGRVVDFIDFQFWPIFNIADIGVTVGGVLFVLSAMFAGDRPATRPA